MKKQQKKIISLFNIMIPFYAKVNQIPNDILYSDPKRKEEVIKLMIKTMENLGFDASSKALEEESGIRITRTVDNEFSKLFYNGKWVFSFIQLDITIYFLILI